MRTNRRQILLAGISLGLGAQQSGKFRWPGGKRAAVSLTFDDARLSHIDTGIPLLDRHGVAATFYLTPSNMERRLPGWKQVAAAGRHEIAHHSASHPCTGNYPFSRANALEDFTLARMEADIDRATERFRRQLGVTPVSFAYPCGQKFIGRGESTQSYVPLVARRFLTGRGFLDESANDPELCDLASLMGNDFDGWRFDQMRAFIETAAKENRWIIFAGHEIGAPGRQTVIAEELERLCRYLLDPANGLWTGAVATVARHVQAERKVK